MFILFAVILVLGVKIVSLPSKKTLHVFTSWFPFFVCDLQKNILLIKVYIASEIIVLLVGLIIYVIILIHLFLAFVIATDDDTSTFVADLVKIFAISTAEVLVIVIVIAFSIIALKAYFLLCVHSYLKELIWLQSGTPQAVGYTAVAETDDTNIKIWRWRWTDI